MNNPNENRPEDELRIDPMALIDEALAESQKAAMKDVDAAIADLREEILDTLRAAPTSLARNNALNICLYRAHLLGQIVKSNLKKSPVGKFLPLEEAMAYKRRLEDRHCTPEEVIDFVEAVKAAADRVGKRLNQKQIAIETGIGAAIVTGVGGQPRISQLLRRTRQPAAHEAIALKLWLLSILEGQISE